MDQSRTPLTSSSQLPPVTLTNVSDTTGKNGTLSASMRVLVGDTNHDRGVNTGDSQQTRSRSGQLPTRPISARMNADGAINSGDAFIVRANSGTGQ